MERMRNDGGQGVRWWNIFLMKCKIFLHSEVLCLTNGWRTPAGDNVTKGEENLECFPGDQLYIFAISAHCSKNAQIVLRFPSSNILETQTSWRARKWVSVCMFRKSNWGWCFAVWIGFGVLSLATTQYFATFQWRVANQKLWVLKRFAVVKMS